MRRDSSMWSRLGLCLLLLSLSACVSDSLKDVRQGSARMVTTTDDLRPPDTTDAGGAYQGVTEYRLGPQDVLDISVYQMNELT